MKKSKIYYDGKSDAIYLFVKDGREEECLEVAPNINVELDKNGQLLGVEILNASKLLGVKPKIKERVLEPV